MFLNLAESRVAVHPAIALDQGSRLLAALTLPQQKQHFGAFPRFELDDHLQGAARIQTRSGVSREFLSAQKRRGMLEARVPAQELEAVTGQGGRAPAQVGEGDPVRELSVPRVPRRFCAERNSR